MKDVNILIFDQLQNKVWLRSYNNIREIKHDQVGKVYQGLNVKIGEQIWGQVDGRITEQVCNKFNKENNGKRTN